MLRLLAAAVAVALFVLLPSAAAQVNPPTLPVGVHLAYGQDPYTSMIVTWSGLATVIEPRVEFGPTPDLGTRVDAQARPLPGTYTSAFTAVLTGLVPGTEYHYRVVHGQASNVFRFRTASPDAPYLKITAWGDHGVPDPLNPVGENDGYAPAVTVANGHRLAPDLHLHPGDLSYANGHAPTWDRYFTMLQPFAATVPYMTAVGNHEREAGQGFTQYDARLRMPSEGTNRWWTLRIGSTQILSLDTEHACQATEADDRVPGTSSRTCEGGANPSQLAFLRSTLAAARSDPSVRWIIAFHHYLLWSDGAHGSNLRLRDIWGPIYDEFRVDLVLQAHDHVYQRSRTLVGNEVMPNGTTYVTVGMGGASHYRFRSPPDERPEWEAASDNQHYGALLLNITGDMIRGEFHGNDARVRDWFAITKDAAGRPIQVQHPEDPARPAPVPPAQERRAPAPAFALTLVVLATLVCQRRR